MPRKPSEATLPKIYAIRRQKVVLDAELAALFGVETRAFNQAVRRNWNRFPQDFAFRVTREEFEALTSQIVTSKQRSQNVILKKDGRGRHSKYLPWVFTEHGAIMAAMVLRSDHAVAMSVYVVRAFVRMRDELMANAAILKRLAEIDRRLLEHDSVLREVVERLQPLLDAPDEEVESKRKIGFVRRAARRAPAQRTPLLRFGAFGHLRALRSVTKATNDKKIRFRFS